MSTGIYNNVDGVLVELTQSEVDAIPSVSESEIKLRDLRTTRNAMLAETDWTQSRDVTLSNDSAWQTYRQALRDITDSATSLDDVTWPTKPE